MSGSVRPCEETVQVDGELRNRRRLKRSAQGGRARVQGRKPKALGRAARVAGGASVADLRGRLIVEGVALSSEDLDLIYVGIEATTSR